MSDFSSLLPRGALRALVLFPVSLHAGAQAGSDKFTPPVVVTASRFEQSQADALPHTTVITAQQIRDSQAIDLPSLLKREAGIQFTQNGGPGASSGLFLRGAETRQTLVLVDGVPLTKQDATGTVSVEHLMLDQVDRIEVVRGNVSSIYGSSAVGGVVQIFTRRGEGPLAGRASIEGGARGTSRLSAGASGSNGGTRYALSASDFKTAGFSSLNTNQIPAANPDREAYANTAVSGALSHEYAKGHEVGARFSANHSRFDFDTAFGTAGDVQTGKTRVETATVFSRNRFTDNWSSTVSYSESSDLNQNRYQSAFGVTQDRYVTKTRMLQWNNEFAVTPLWSANIGFERQWHAFDSNDGFGGIFATRRTAGSFYGGLQGKAGPHQFQFNLRHDKVGDVESATTGYVGYGYALTPEIKAIGSVATGFSAPPLGYLYAPFFGNPNLKPERARSAEIGLQYQSAQTLVRATVFNTRTTQQLQFDPLTGRFDNIARVRNHGLEVSASSNWLGVDWRASLTLQDPRDESNDQRVRRRAQTLVSLAADKHFGPWQVGGDIGYTGARPDGVRQLEAYTVVNLTSRYRINREVSVFGRIENLFDRDYQTAWGYNQPPRGVFVGLSWQQ